MPILDVPTVFITGDLSERQVAELREATPGAVIRYFADPVAMLDHAQDATAIVGPVSPELLARATHLKWVHSWLAGPDAQLTPAFVEHPVTLTSSKGNGAIPLAEHAMMLMLMLNRNARHWLEAQRDRRWDRFVHGELNGLTCGIIGTGHSGQDLARKAKAFHMKVVGLRRSEAEAEGFDQMYRPEGLHAFLAQSDFVVVTVPGTAATMGMLGEPEFRAMKPTAFFICFSRGGIADDGALLHALNEGWIAGAGLDAHAIEPLPPDSPFWSAPNTIVTPHNGATTEQTKERGFRILVENLTRFVAGEPLINLVNKRFGY